MDKDLFGQEPAPEKKRKGKGGYARPPGTGPAGETCKSCEHYCHVYQRSGRYYRKCGLIESNWTHGSGTDIKAGSPACDMWEKQKPENHQGE